MKHIIDILGRLCRNIYKHNNKYISAKKYIYFFIYQKIFRFNSHVPWPVHYTSMVNGTHNILFKEDCTPGAGPFQYIQGGNGIHFGRNVILGPGVQIISMNHSPNDYTKHLKCEPICIGDNVWIGANSTILPSVNIGHNVIIGAGSIITKDIPSNCIAAGNPCKFIKPKDPYEG